MNLLIAVTLLLLHKGVENRQARFARKHFAHNGNEGNAGFAGLLIADLCNSFTPFWPLIYKTDSSGKIRIVREIFVRYSTPHR